MPVTPATRAITVMCVTMLQAGEPQLRMIWRPSQSILRPASDLHATRFEALPGQPASVGLRPGAPSGEEALAKEQLGEPLAGAHEVNARVVTGAHQIAGVLIGDAGHAHRDEFPQAQQLGQPRGIAKVGLDPLIRSTSDAAGGATKRGSVPLRRDTPNRSRWAAAW